MLRAARISTAVLTVFRFGVFRDRGALTLRVQVLNIHILTQNLYYDYYYPNPKYLIIGYMDPLGYVPINVVLGF